MLSVLPPYDRPRERESERPFKSYSSRALNQHHHNSSSAPYYSPFSTNSYLGFPPNNGVAKQEAAMDLRPQVTQGMYDQHHQRAAAAAAAGGGYHSEAGMMDMASHMSHRIPNIKPETSHHQQMHNSHPAMSYPNMNQAHSNGYTNLTATTNMPNLREMGSPPQATLPTLGDNANSPPQSTTGNVNANNSSTQGARLDSSPVMTSSSQATDSSPSVSPPGGLLLPTTIVPNPSSLTETTCSSRMPPKKRPIAVPDTLKDSNYWDKRKKNNESARRSRESRRVKEDQIAMRVVYLEQENLQLRTEVSLLKTELEKLRCMLYNS